MVRSVLLVEASDMTSEWNTVLLESLKRFPQFEKDNKINISTDIDLRTADPVIQAFNVFLRKLHAEGTERIIISL